MSQYRPIVPDKYHVVSNLFYNFCTKLWKYNHATMNRWHSMCFTKLTQPWCTVVISTLERRYEFDVVVSALFRLSKYNIHDIFWGTLTIQRCKCDVVISTLWKHYECDIAIFAFQQRCQYSAQYGELNLLSKCGINVTTMFRVGCMTERRQNVVCLLGCDRL